MDTPKNLTKIGGVLSGLGLLDLIFNFFNMYNLVSACPNGSSGCQAYTTWHLLNWLGIALILFGLILIVISYTKRSSNK
jgi:hypothetical protein